MRASYLYKVKNKDRRTNGSFYYWYMEYNDMGFLFTDNDLNKALKRSQNNQEDIPKEKFY